MKKLVIFLLCGIVSYSAQSQTKSAISVSKAVADLTKAMVDPDSIVLDKLVDKNLSYGHSGGKIENKESFITNILNGNSDFVSIDLTDQTIHIKGKTAIVRHNLSATTNDKGKAVGSIKLAILLVWVKDHKEWKLIARQAVKPS